MLQLRCTYCQTPFSLRREEALIALQEMASGELTHFDAHCPKCRRANQIPRNRLERSYPGWQQALKELEKEAAKAEKEQVTAAKPEPAAAMKKGSVKETKAASSSKATGAASAKESGSVKKEEKTVKATAPKTKEPAAKTSGNKATGKVKAKKE